MKVTFLTRHLGYGGAERQLVVLAKGLHERGHSVTVTVFYAGGLLENELHKAGVTMRSVNKRGRWDVVGFLFRLLKIVRQEKPDILHGYLGVPNILTIFLAPIFPRTQIVWGVRASNIDLKNYDWLTRLSYKIECWLSQFAHLIIVNSDAGLSYAVSHGFPKNKMVVIHNGIDTEHFNPDRTAGWGLRMEWGVGGDEKLVGLVGRLDPMKDHLTFLKAAALLAREWKSVRFVCVGDGPAHYRQKLVNVCNELGLAERFTWDKGRSDMRVVYNTLDILVSSSSYGEGFPNVVGEAMACGVPCVVTDVGDSAWVVAETGEVVPPQRPEALRIGVERMLEKISVSNLAKVSSRRRIIEAFSISQLVANTENAILLLRRRVGAL